MDIRSTTTEKVVKKTIVITLETSEEVATFAMMVRDIYPISCGDEVLANKIRNALRIELEK